MDKAVSTETRLDFDWGQPGTQPASVATAVTIEGLRHSYGGEDAVRGVSLTVEPGEIVCLLGHSGCGKTTLLRLLAGIERPYAGTIRIDQRVVAGPNTFIVPEKREVGLMFQDFALFPHLTVLENVTFGLNTLKKEDQRREAMRALGRVGLAHTADDHPHMLSGGMQQRVALARAIVPRPRVMLMDEPFSGLDRRTRDRVRDETLAILREMRATTIVVTHDPDEALRIADRIVLMRAGKIVQDGHARTFYEKPADLFAARFFHELNEFEGVVRNGQVMTPLGLIAAPGHADGTPVLIGLRQSAIAIDHDDTLDGGLPARVRAVQFLGEADLLHLAVPGYERPIFVRTSETDRFKQGQSVNIAVHPNSALIFQKPDAQPT
ncbi:MAG: ABC transporter ATP-binding protein [Hyphomicrobiales bacterium]|jgi:iron(III) transport system ATP-binding protein